jgi:hypothetical protein
LNGKVNSPKLSHIAPKPPVKLASQEKMDAVFKDMNAGLVAQNNQILKVQNLEKLVKEGKADKAQLTTENLRLQEIIEKYERDQYKLIQLITEEKAKLDKGTAENKVLRELLAEQERLYTEQSEKYKAFYIEYEKMQKENYELRKQTNTYRNELNLDAIHSYRSTTKVSLIVGGVPRNVDEYKQQTIQRQVDEIKVIYNFSVSPYATNLPSKLVLVAEIPLYGKTKTNLRKEVTLVKVDCDGSVCYSGSIIFTEKKQFKDFIGSIKVYIEGAESNFSISKPLRIKRK